MEGNAAPLGTESMDDLLRAGVAAAKSGDRERARELLLQVVEHDEERAVAWLWLSGVVDSLEDREVCLENVLALDPDNDAARRGLVWVRAQKRIPAHEAPDRSTLGPSPSHPALQPKPLWDEPPDPLLCPYCASGTAQSDRRCATCGNELSVKMRRREEHSLWLWNLMVVRLAMAIGYALLPLLALTYVTYAHLGKPAPLMLVPVYLGLESDVAPELSKAALATLPRIALLPFFGLALYSLALLAGMYLRWRLAYVLMLVGVAVRFAAGVVAAVLGQYYGLVCGGVGSVLGFVSFYIMLQVQDDFAWDTERVYFGLDPKAKGGAARFERARAFSERGMWALAALYLRAALARMPGHAGGYARLADAYLRLGRRDLAAAALEDAKRIDPHDPSTAELATLIEGGGH